LNQQKHVLGFSNIIREVAADNNFLKTFNASHNTCFNDLLVINSADWFDRECTIARNRYLEAL
jgi:hypothetical protein